MLSDEVIEKVVDRLARRIEKINIYVLKSIARTIKEIGTIAPSDSRKLIEIMNFGGDYKKIVKKISKMTKLNQKEIYEIFEEVAKSDLDFAKDFYAYRNKRFIPYEKNIALKKQVEAIASITANEYANMSKTLAFSRVVKGKRVYSAIGETYNSVIDDGIIAITQGKDTFNQQMKKIIKELAKSGIKTIDWESGISRSLEYAVRMHLESGITNLHNELQRQIGKELDMDGVEITAHSFPAPDHQYAQGKQFKNEEYDKLQETGIAKDYKGRIVNLHRERKNGSRGESFRPIGELNCKHYTFSVILGVNEPNYTDKELKEIIKRNNDGFTYKGKHYTMYEGTQLQRKIENQVRKEKIALLTAKESGETGKELAEESQNKIDDLVNEYYKLSRASGLSPKLDRLQVYE